VKVQLGASKRAVHSAQVGGLGTSAAKAGRSARAFLTKDQRSMRTLEAFAVISLDLAAKKAAQLIIAEAPAADDQEEKENAGKNQKNTTTAVKPPTVRHLLDYALASEVRQVLPQSQRTRAGGQRATFAPTTTRSIDASETGIALNPLRTLLDERSAEKQAEAPPPAPFDVTKLADLTHEALAAAVLKAPMVTELLNQELEGIKQSNSKAAAKARREAWLEARQQVLLIIAACSKRIPGVNIKTAKGLPKAADGSAKEAGTTTMMIELASKDEQKFSPLPAPALSIKAPGVATRTAGGGKATPLARPSFGGSSAFSFSLDEAGAKAPLSPPLSATSTASSAGGWSSPLSPFALPGPHLHGGYEDVERSASSFSGQAATTTTLKKVNLGFQVADNPLAIAAVAARRPSVKIMAALSQPEESAASRAAFPVPGSSRRLLRTRSSFLIPGAGDGQDAGTTDGVGQSSASRNHLRRASRFPVSPILAPVSERRTLTGAEAEAFGAAFTSSERNDPSSSFASMLAPKPVMRFSTRKKISFSSVGTGADATATLAAGNSSSSATTTDIDAAAGSPTADIPSGLSFFKKQSGARLSLVRRTTRANVCAQVAAVSGRRRGH
jgi:hypothetical protein